MYSGTQITDANAGWALTQKGIFANGRPLNTAKIRIRDQILIARKPKIQILRMRPAEPAFPFLHDFFDRHMM
jgi:hypothetical protein